MSNWVEITYRDFYDFPRIFTIRHQGKLLLFDCNFDSTLDDYSPTYKVFLLPELTSQELADDWTHLPEKAGAFLGEVPTDQVEFDQTRRRAVNIDAEWSGWRL
jgi:hypothetical protein